MPAARLLDRLRNGALAVALLLVGFVIGLDWPDVDQRVPFIGHRSILTHSVLLAALVWRRLPALGGGLGVGIAVHLLADLFPNAMTGYATIKLPLVGSIGAPGSYLWLAANALAGLALAAAAVGRLPRMPAIVLLATLALASGAYLATTDGGWWVLAILLAALAVFALTRRRRPSVR